MFFSEPEKIDLKQNQHQSKVQAAYYGFVEEQSLMAINLGTVAKVPEGGKALM